MWKIIKEDEKSHQVHAIRIDKIKCGTGFQPRFEIRDEDIESLAESIKEVGVLQPVLVRPKGGYYELIAGERRLRASIKAGLSEIPAVVKEMSDIEAAEIALIENLQRRNLHFFEEANGFARLIAEFNLTQNDVAKRMGISQSAVANKLRLLRLPPDIREEIYRLKLSERHARALLELPDREKQLRLLKLAEEKEPTVSEWEKMIKREKDQNISREIKLSRKKNIKPLIKDLRLFLNSLERGVETLRAAGLDVELHHQRHGSSLKIIIEVVENV
ncbi:MAG TPA: ParB/RepB/Spo0J family partition protein [Syntrophomonadaceae bacterium]|nr:ParB/RepB/Spo0J family partition protein [Syntrophomonadaceae bacterium]